MRQSYFKTVKFSTSGESVVAVPRDPSRMEILFSPPTTGYFAVAVARRGEDVGPHGGILLGAGSPPLVFTKDRHGDIVCQAWTVQPGPLDGSGIPPEEVTVLLSSEG